MEWNQKLQNIIEYVENHLQREEETIDNEEISKMAGCSFDFFQKVFSYMNGISFSEYVRSRKLTLAGYDLKSTNMKVVDISYKYGYNSPTSFTKAFQQFHGISPKDARQEAIKLCVTPKMQIAGEQQYVWKLERKKAFRLIGKSIRVSCINNKHYEKIPEFWSECQKNGTYSALVSFDTGNPKGIFGLFGYYDKSTNEIEYSIMVISDKDTPQGFTEMFIPNSVWAIFDCRGNIPQSIHKGWKYLNEEWLIKYPFKHAKCPELEWYSDGNVYSENYLSQIWIPILEEE
ncbi:MAG: effector binding domain-containing protein [Eubacteriales bacterium]|nr:effector binding domain-containing protein [Eubacteriales bacterium]